MIDAAATAHSGVRQTSGSRCRACHSSAIDIVHAGEEEDNREYHGDCSMRDAK